MKLIRQVLLKPAMIAAFVALLGGCSMPSPTGPNLSATGGGTAFSSAHTDATNSAGAVQTLFTLLSMPPLLSTSGGAATNPPAGAWYVVGQKTVTTLGGGVVTGSRYKVTVPAGSVLKSTTITIEEWNSNVLDFQLKPHGQQFLVPVVVTVDYSGTAADPSSPLYDGSTPAFLYFNPGTGFWEVVVSTNDPTNKKITALLTHFSRYAVSKGTAEW